MKSTIRAAMGGHVSIKPGRATGLAFLDVKAGGTSQDIVFLELAKEELGILILSAQCVYDELEKAGH